MPLIARTSIEQVQAAGARQQSEDEVVFGLLPMFHIFGLNVVLGASLAVGARVSLPAPVFVSPFVPARVALTVAA